MLASTIELQTRTSSAYTDIEHVTSGKVNADSNQIMHQISSHRGKMEAKMVLKLL